MSSGYLFLNTQKGLTLASEFAQQWLPGKLKISELNGCLLGPIQIKDLYYRDPNTELSISSAQFDWHWSHLLQGHFVISSLFIDKLILSIKENHVAVVAKTHAKKFQFPWILKHIRLNSANIKQVLVHYGANFLRLNGSLHKQWQFNWQLTIPQLDKFIPESKGQLFLQGKIRGDRLFPEFYLLLPETDLTWKDWQLKQIKAEFYLECLKNKKWHFNIKATQLQNTTLSLHPIGINFSGNLQPFSLQGSLSRFKLNRRTDISQINIPKGFQDVVRRTRTNARSVLGSHEHVSTDVQQHHILKDEGYSIVIPDSNIVARLRSGLEASLITNPTSEEQLSVHIQLPHYQIRPEVNPKQAIQGNIQLTLKNVNYLGSIIPALKNPQGFLDAKLNLSGSMFSPLIDVSLNLKKGSTQIPSLGLYLKNINLAFHTDKKQLQGTGRLDSGKGSLTFQSKTQLDHLNFLSNIHVKGNNLEISHTREYKITASPELQIQADTHHIVASGLIVFPKAKITVNENNENLIELSNDVVFVNQKKKSLSLPFTYKNDVKITLGNEVSFSYQGLSTKVIGTLHINQTTDHPILATGELALTKGEYTYYGQSLTLQPHSLLTFANSPIDNPDLDVSASKSVWVMPTNNTTDPTKSQLGSSNFISTALQTTQPIRTTVGVHLQGYLENPQITLYADPASAIASQLDILSYLTTGQPSNQLSAGSMQLLLSTATHLGGKQSGLSQLISSAQKKIGIDQLTIGANPIFNPNTNSLEQNTSIIVGKNFSPRLNVSYSLGLLDPISILQINYLLNKHFSLQSTNSNFANGIDLLYKVEKN